ncbi:MAG: translation initiation factor IF-2 [Deltaproteobacteria bacterium]|nr:MAG: translation initiation factor IF-2 [Deltaproteobacteria bacterium]
MAKMRAYKLAEELGIERNELVEKAAGLGIELKSAMASLDEESVALIREKLGTGRKQQVVEERVERKGGGAVIRRRRRAAPPPPPEPEVVAPPEAAEEEAEAPAEPAPPTEALPAEEAPPTVEVVPPIAAEAPAAELAPEPAAARPRVAAEPGRGRAGELRAPAGPGKGRGRERKRVREVVNLREQDQLVRQAGRVVVRRSVAMDSRGLASPRRKRRDAAPPRRPAVAKPKEPQKRSIRVDGAVSVAELARLLGAKAPEVQGKLMALGTMASINQTIDVETATKLAETYGFEVQDVGFREEEYLEAAPEGGGALEPRPPIVTVMGHVDHGKTSLLDAIRKANVVAGEAGGITQHIGAYQVEVGGDRITFIDTPGHAAFTAMRARGANVTDLVVLIVAADDGIMPQTVEAIDHAKAAGVPILVAVNKIDLPDANSRTIRQRLMEHGLVTEDFGGDTICVDVSATKGTGIEQLLEMVKLQAEVLELRADPAMRASGVVLEAELDKGRGPVATVLVKEGTLRRGDVVVLGTAMGKIRAMQDERGRAVKEAGPSVPVQVLGLQSTPSAGDLFHVVESERVAKEITAHRSDQQRDATASPRPKVSLEDLFAQGEEGGAKELAIVLKADVQGSVEAIRDALEKLSTEKVSVEVVHAGVGAVNESDVMLARASNAIVIGFHVRPDAAARRAAEGQGVDVRHYRIIYEATDDIKAAMAGLLPPVVEEKVLGQAEVRRVFVVPRVGTVAGCYVTEGVVRRNAQCRLLRDGAQVYSGRVGSLKRFKDDAREVQKDFECGIGIDGYNDVKIGDVIEVFAVEETPASL